MAHFAVKTRAVTHSASDAELFHSNPVCWTTLSPQKQLPWGDSRGTARAGLSPCATQSRAQHPSQPARYLRTKARQLRRAPATPRTYQLFHNQGGKLRVIVSSDKETLQVPGPEGPGQRRFLSPPSEQRRATELRANQGSAPAPRLQPAAPHAPLPPLRRCPSRGRRSGRSGLGGGRRPETPRPGGSHEGGRPPHAAPVRREAAAGGPGRGRAGDGWARAGGGWQRPGRAERRRLQPRAPGAGGGARPEPARRGEPRRGLPGAGAAGERQSRRRRQRRRRLRLPGPRPLCRGRREPPPRPRGACRQRPLSARPARPLTAPHPRARGSRSASAASASGPARGLPPAAPTALPRLPPPRNGAVGASGASNGDTRRVNSDFHSRLYCLTHWLSLPVFPLFPSYPAFFGFSFPLIRRPPLSLWLWHGSPGCSVPSRASAMPTPGYRNLRTATRKRNQRMARLGTDL